MNSLFGGVANTLGAMSLQKQSHGQSPFEQLLQLRQQMAQQGAAAGAGAYQAATTPGITPLPRLGNPQQGAAAGASAYRAAQDPPVTLKYFGKAGY